MPVDVQHFLYISLDEVNKLLHIRWLRPVSSEEYRAGILYCKQLVLEKRVERWLIDSRKLDHILFSDQQWIKREVAMGVRESALRKLARVLTDDVFNYISFENMLQHITEEHGTPVEIGQFSSEDAALNWLSMD